MYWMVHTLNQCNPLQSKPFRSLKIRWTAIIQLAIPLLCTWLVSGPLQGAFHLISNHGKSREVGIVIPISEMKKLNLRNSNWPAQTRQTEIGSPGWKATSYLMLELTSVHFTNSSMFKITNTVTLWYPDWVNAVPNPFALFRTAETKMHFTELTRISAWQLDVSHVSWALSWKASLTVNLPSDNAQDMGGILPK